MSDSISQARLSPSAPEMPPAPSGTPPAVTPTRRLRLWPGVVIVALELLALRLPGWLGLDPIAQFMAMFWAPIVAAAALAIWWLFFSRLRWADRLLGVAVAVGFGLAAWGLLHPSYPGMGLLLYGVPIVTIALVGWLVVSFFLSWPVRRIGLVVVLLLAWGYFPLLRLEGLNGSFTPKTHWRWTPTPEDRFLVEIASRKAADASAPAAAGPLALQPGDWPAFRGPDRDSRLTGVRLATDWAQHPPREVWRHRIGPGWSSFAVVAGRLYTQEQRGDDELVVCYDAASGAELWVHRDATRFTEMLAGAGPRATPTFHEGNLYTLGANGRLNCLDPATGAVRWTRDIPQDAGAKVPQWGFSSSPLVVGGVVMVFAGGPNGKSVLGYHTSSGDLAWSAGEGKLSYSSPHLAHLGGVEQVLIATDAGLTSIAPASGTVLWKHAWEAKDMARIVQPALVGDSDVLIGTGMTLGTRRISVRREGDGWAADKEVWTKKAIKPYFNDLVVHEGHLYGFDDSFFTCVGLEDGKGCWRARGYGNGQVLLLADQGVLLVLSEEGEVALVAANPQRHQELARFKAIEGKTWNHPVIAHGKLYVRNGEEVACFQLTEESSAASSTR
jgi:outer membrane protein assembly factor BamB